MKLSKKLSKTKSAIDLKINRLGLKKSNYNYDYSFFNEINSELKAYWLGFIAADGCVSVNENTRDIEKSESLMRKTSELMYNYIINLE